MLCDRGIGKLHFILGRSLSSVRLSDTFLITLRTFAALFEGKMRCRAGIRDEVKSQVACFDPFLASGPTYLSWSRTKCQHGQRRFCNAAHKTGSLKDIIAAKE